MGAKVVDYRISTMVVMCNDCGQDVGLYPSRHKCQPNRPPMPPLPTRYQNEAQHNISRKPVPDLGSPQSLAPHQTHSRPSSAASSSSSDLTASPSSGKWANRFGGNSGQRSPLTEDEDDSIYFNKFSAHLPEEEQQGRKFWGKARQNEKWKQMTEKSEQKTTGKLWGKLLQATQTMADKIPVREEKGAESDESDWEGETHVSRVLREYYEKQRRPLPGWLRDERTPTRRSTQDLYQEPRHQSSPSHHEPNEPTVQRTRTARRRLWERDEEPKQEPASHRQTAPARQEPKQEPARQEPRERQHDRYRSHHDDYDRGQPRRDYHSESRGQQRYDYPEPQHQPRYDDYQPEPRRPQRYDDYRQDDYPPDRRQPRHDDYHQDRRQGSRDYHPSDPSYRHGSYQEHRYDDAPPVSRRHGTVNYGQDRGSAQDDYNPRSYRYR
ncbi:hypothetical protein DM01DRAFT_1380728 [Hesseltinella vesiculosa]|uniref:Mso1 N-terminal domain-containing protein n=1 Tax=Hesseltinella vesiculosa TaxID=101127 RepID=A0A1X2GSE0_9FUNG|nr:hypothetical protein DM01DRAFT_1380728 [Hesseltinella vesiculosa]